MKKYLKEEATMTAKKKKEANCFAHCKVQSVHWQPDFKKGKEN
jgi:hypothetical protein